MAVAAYTWIGDNFLTSTYKCKNIVKQDTDIASAQLQSVISF